MSQYELRPRTQLAAPPVTFESIYALLLEERAAREILEGILQEERAD